VRRAAAHAADQCCVATWPSLAWSFRKGHPPQAGSGLLEEGTTEVPDTVREIVSSSTSIRAISHGEDQRPDVRAEGRYAGERRDATLVKGAGAGTGDGRCGDGV
jgi:hypothetical protein